MSGKDRALLCDEADDALRCRLVFFFHDPMSRFEVAHGLSPWIPATPGKGPSYLLTQFRARKSDNPTKTQTETVPDCLSARGQCDESVPGELRPFKVAWRSSYALLHLPVFMLNFTFPVARICISNSCNASVLLLLGSSSCCSG